MVRILKTWIEREGASTFPKHDGVTILGIHHGTSTSYSTYTADVTTDFHGKVSGGGTRTRSDTLYYIGISAENHYKWPMAVYAELKDIDADGFTKGKFKLRIDLDPKEKKFDWTELSGAHQRRPENLTLVEIAIGTQKAGKVDWSNGVKIVHDRTLADAFKTEQQRAEEARDAEERDRRKTLRALKRLRRRKAAMFLLKVAMFLLITLLSGLGIACLASKPFYRAGIHEPGKIENSSGLSCWLYSFGF